MRKIKQTIWITEETLSKILERKIKEAPNIALNEYISQIIDKLFNSQKSEEIKKENIIKEEDIWKQKIKVNL